MFGLADKILLKKCGTLNLDYDPIKIKSDLEKPGPVWVCFLPSRSYDDPKLRKRCLPKNSPYIAYRVPREFVKSDPKKTREILDKILNHALITVDKHQFKDIYVLGSSAGGAIALSFINQIPSKKLILLTPGYNVVECIKEGSLTKDLYNDSLKKGFTYEMYEKELGKFTTKVLNNAPEDITIYISFWDKVVPYKHGRILINKLKQIGKKPKVKTRFLLGHALTICLYKNKY